MKMRIAAKKMRNNVHNVISRGKLGFSIRLRKMELTAIEMI